MKCVVDCDVIVLDASLHAHGCGHRRDAGGHSLSGELELGAIHPQHSVHLPLLVGGIHVCAGTIDHLCCGQLGSALGKRRRHYARAEALRLARQAESKAARNEQYATLGRYMTDMKHSVSNALTSMIGNAELLLLEPGQLSKQSLQQIKTIHSMALRINEIMLRFSSLSNEMQEAENASQAETEEAPAPSSRRR